MRCANAAELMSDYIDGCLDQRKCTELEQHLGECAGCAGELRATRELVASLSTLSGCESPVDCWAATRERIIRHGGRAPMWRAWLLKPVFALPAVAVILFVALLVMRPAQLGPPQATALVSPQEYRSYLAAHTGLQRQQVLTDPDVTFVTAELENATLSSERARP